MTQFVTPDTEKALRLPVGAVSPLWLMFGAAALTGAAVFWARAWLKPTNLEAALPALPLATAEAVAPVLEAAQETLETAAEETEEAAAEVVETVESVADETVETVVEAAPVVEATVEVAVDDLTRLTGIGPKLAQSLAERGVTRFADIAAWTAEDVEAIDKDLKLMGRVDREAWIAQAKRFAEAAVH